MPEGPRALHDTEQVVVFGVRDSRDERYPDAGERSELMEFAHAQTAQDLIEFQLMGHEVAWHIFIASTRYNTIF